MKSLAIVLGFTGMVAFSGAAWSQAAPALGSTGSPPASVATPSATAAVSMLQNACLPLVNGGDLKKVARTAGLKLRNGQWMLPVSGKRQLDLQPPDDVNPHVCTVVIIHRIGGDAAILQAINTWAAAQTPPLQPIKVLQKSVGVTYQRTTSTWASQSAKGAEGLVLASEKTLDGKPVAGDDDQSELILSFTPQAGAQPQAQKPTAPSPAKPL